jgi:hypothetical protein
VSENVAVNADALAALDAAVAERHKRQAPRPVYRLDPALIAFRDYTRIAGAAYRRLKGKRAERFAALEVCAAARLARRASGRKIAIVSSEARPVARPRTREIVKVAPGRGPPKDEEVHGVSLADHLLADRIAAEVFSL